MTTEEQCVQETHASSFNKYTGVSNGLECRICKAKAGRGQTRDLITKFGRIGKWHKADCPLRSNDGN